VSRDKILVLTPGLPQRQATANFDEFDGSAITLSRLTVQLAKIARDRHQRI